jgi:hypothetical protein
MKFDERQMVFDGFELEDDVRLEAETRRISMEEARQISEAARQVFEQGAQEIKKNEEGEVEFENAWYEDYLMLRTLGWPWRVATYIAWAASPKLRREPRTLNELADKVLGLNSPRAVHTWRDKYVTIDAVVNMMQAKPTLEYRRDVYDALVKVAATQDHKCAPDRKLYMEMTGDYVPHMKIDERIGKATDLTGLSDEELDALGAKRVIEERLRKGGENGQDASRPGRDASRSGRGDPAPTGDDGNG